MKRIFRMISLLICMVLFMAMIPLTVSAVTPIDPERLSSLTLQYAHNGRYYEGLEIRSYRIAEVHENGTYDLIGSFREYPVKIYEVTSHAEWRQIASTLAAYAEADWLEPTCTAVTDTNGIVSFTDILPGMYLTTAVTHTDGSAITVFENFLTVVPYPNEDGNHNYDVTAYPKCESHPLGIETEYKVVKLWKDSGYEELRPDSVTVDILKNGVLWESEILSSENNWSYQWTAEDDGSIWQVVEREIPAEYTVTIVKEQNTFIITNCTVYDISSAPQTGDAGIQSGASMLMCISGGILLVLAAWRKKNKV
ncbi:MAG: Cna B-type domain-containing protein [Clostridia bacterium]|nr:Cna B-type domain-containing protein [Clostridia bacterium]